MKSELNNENLTETSNKQKNIKSNTNKKSKNCLFNFWCRMFKKNKKDENDDVFYNTNNKLTSKNNPYKKISKTCSFQCQSPIGEINFNTCELFDENTESNYTPSIDKTTTESEVEFTPVSPQDNSYTYIKIYLNPSYNVQNKSKKSKLNLVDLRFQLPTYSYLTLIILHQLEHFYLNALLKILIKFQIIQN